ALFARVTCSTVRIFSRTASLLHHFNRDFRTIRPRKPGPALQARRYRAVTALTCVSELIEIEQFRRQRLAARVALTFLLVDAYFQLSGHCGRSLVTHALRALCSPWTWRHRHVVTGHEIIGYHIRAAVVLSISRSSLAVLLRITS